MTNPPNPAAGADLIRRIGSHAPADVLFWSGAGISTSPPTSLPTGWALTQRVFRACFEPHALATVLSYQARSGWYTSTVCDRRAKRDARPPRLETVLGVAVRRFGTLAHGLLEDFRTQPPNAVHRFLAAHLAADGSQVTANFDTCIERAFAASYGKAPIQGLTHFHNNLDESTTPAELGATLEQVQRGFSPEYEASLVERVALTPATVVIGYSGSDFFDVDVAFARLAHDHLAGREVFWVAHSNHHGQHGWHEIEAGHPGQPPLGRHLRAAGAMVRYFCGPTEELLTGLADAWGFDPDIAGKTRVEDLGTRAASANPAPTQPKVNPSDLIDIDGRQRRAATLALYRELGIPREVERMLAAGGLDGVDPAELWLARSEVLWEQGRWNTLRRMWTQQPPPGINPTTRVERIGACLWAQGRLMPAYLWLGWHRRRALRAGHSNDAWTLAETQARVVEHMARTPELRLLARMLARPAAARLGVPSQSHGVHTFRRHTDLATSLAETAAGRTRAGDEAGVSQQWFTEAGSIIAAVAYHHRALRDSYDPSRPRADVAREYRSHFRWATQVGSRAAAWRMILLPDADRVFTLREVLTGVFALDYAPWHRFRIMTRSVVHRVLARLRSRPG